MTGEELLALDDDHFAATWFRMSDSDRAALAPVDRAAGIRRYVQLSGGGRGLEQRRPKINGAARVNSGVHAETVRTLPHVETAAALLKREMPAPEKLCDPWCVEGLCIIAGRPKLGKTTLLRQKAAALAEGASLWGSLCERATVLFLSLEEGARLMRRKLELATFPEAALENIRLVYEWPRGLGPARFRGRAAVGSRAGAVAVHLGLELHAGPRPTRPRTRAAGRGRPDRITERRHDDDD